MTTPVPASTYAHGLVHLKDHCRAARGDRDSKTLDGVFTGREDLVAWLVRGASGACAECSPELGAEVNDARDVLAHAYVDAFLSDAVLPDASPDLGTAHLTLFEEAHAFDAVTTMESRFRVGADHPATRRLVAAVDEVDRAVRAFATSVKGRAWRREHAALDVYSPVHSFEDSLSRDLADLRARALDLLTTSEAVVLVRTCDVDDYVPGALTLARLSGEAVVVLSRAEFMLLCAQGEVPEHALLDRDPSPEVLEAVEVLARTTFLAEALDMASAL